MEPQEIIRRRLCYGCQHFVDNDLHGPMCMRLVLWARSAPDLVYGRTQIPLEADAEQERRSASPVACGPDGRWWEPSGWLMQAEKNAVEVGVHDR